MSVGLDTSVVLRLLTGTPPAEAEAARARLRAADGAVAVSDLVIGETYFALRHHYAVPHADAVQALDALLADPGVQAPGVARAVVREAAARAGRAGGAGLMDRLIAADYARDGHAVLTFDRDLGRLPGSELLRGGGRAAR